MALTATIYNFDIDLADADLIPFVDLAEADLTPPPPDLLPPPDLTLPYICRNVLAAL